MIKIIDNFFEDILFKNVQNHVTTKLSFKPRYLDYSKENNKNSYYGMRFELNKDPNLLKTFISQTEKKFKIKKYMKTVV